MKEIKTKIIEANKPVETVFYAMSDFSHFSAVGENDKVKDFQCTYDTCSFRVADMADIALRITDRKPFEYITIVSDKEIMGGFSFAMNFVFTKKSDWSCQLQGICNVEGNAMALMMIKKQIENALNMLMDSIEKALNQ